MYCISRKCLYHVRFKEDWKSNYALMKYNVCLLKIAGPVHCMCGGITKATSQTTVFLACLWEHSPVTHFSCSPVKKKRLTGEDCRRLKLLHRSLLSLVIHTLQYYYSFNTFDVTKCKLKYRRVDIDKIESTKMLMYFIVDNSKLSISNHYTLHLHISHINLKIGFSHKTNVHK